jgi:hypothetical protein
MSFEFDPMKRTTPFRGVVCANPTPTKAEPVSQYIIWNPAASSPPRIIHNTRPEAIRIAGGMAHKEPGATFYVCKLVNSAQKPLPISVDYKDLESQ